MCIFHAHLTQSLWSGYHWKYLFLLENLSIGDAKFGQRWWCQEWNKGQPILGTAAYSRHRHQWINKDFFLFFSLPSCCQQLFNTHYKFYVESSISVYFYINKIEAAVFSQFVEYLQSWLHVHNWRAMGLNKSKLLEISHSTIKFKSSNPRTF